MRKAFNFYRSYYDMYQELDDKQKVQFIDAIMKVQFFEENISKISFDDKLVNMVWVSIKHSIEAQILGFCRADKINYDDIFDTPPTTPRVTPPTTPQQEEGQEKDKVQEKGKGKGELAAPLRSAKQTQLIDEFMSYHNNFNGDGDDIKSMMQKFIQYRSQIKKPVLTVSAVNGFFKSMVDVIDAGFDPDEAFEIMTENQWQTIKVDYLEKKGKK